MEHGGLLAWPLSPFSPACLLACGYNDHLGSAMAASLKPEHSFGSRTQVIEECTVQLVGSSGSQRGDCTCDSVAVAVAR